MTAAVTSRHCLLCKPDECCDGTGMLMGREVEGFGPVYECNHCHCKLAATILRPSSPPCALKPRSEGAIHDNHWGLDGHNRDAGDFVRLSSGAAEPSWIQQRLVRHPQPASIGALTGGQLDVEFDPVLHASEDQAALDWSRRIADTYVVGRMSYNSPLEVLLHPGVVAGATSAIAIAAWKAADLWDKVSVVRLNHHRRSLEVEALKVVRQEVRHVRRARRSHLDQVELPEIPEALDDEIQYATRALLRAESIVVEET